MRLRSTIAVRECTTRTRFAKRTVDAFPSTGIQSGFGSLAAIAGIRRPDGGAQ